MSAIDEYQLPGIMRNIIKKLSAREGIIGVVLVDPDGFTLDTNMDQVRAEIISGFVHGLVIKAKEAIKSVKNSGILTSMSIEMDTKELIITPDPDGQFTIVILKERDGKKL